VAFSDHSRLDNDTREKGTTGPFETWESDHTALVHVLWACSHDGLTLTDDFDDVASRIFRSRWLAAVRDEAAR
jgi:hypothetical protein